MCDDSNTEYELWVLDWDWVGMVANILGWKPLTSLVYFLSFSNFDLKKNTYLPLLELAIWYYTWNNPVK